MKTLIHSSMGFLMATLLWFVVPNAAWAGTFTVTNSADSGTGSLRAAITLANASPGSTIKFNIPTTDTGHSNGVWTIKPLSTLPFIVANGTIIDGSTQKDFVSQSNPVGPAIALDGSSLPTQTFVSGLFISASNCVVRQLVIENFHESAGITIEGDTGGTRLADSNRIEGCYIGTDATGTVAALNDSGIVLRGDNNANGAGVTHTTVGGDTVAERNVINGANYGVAIYTANTANNTVTGNYIGLNRTGTAKLGCTYGVGIAQTSVNNTVGGTTSSLRNIICGSQSSVEIFDVDCTGNKVLGNYIGTDVTGTIGLGGGDSAIALVGSQNQIGGTTTGAGNLVASSYHGINITGNGNTVQGNIVGLGATNAALPNNIGIAISSGAQNNLIGGTVAGAANVISGNNICGVDLVGTDPTSTPNATTANKVQGNIIGLAPDAETARGNAIGVIFEFGALSNQLGGTTTGTGNLIAGNTSHGVDFGNTGTSLNTVQGNTIRANGGNGVTFDTDSTGNIVGANASATSLTGVANTITANSGDGVRVISASSGNSVRGNSISGNGGLGINLVAPNDPTNGVTINDAGDSDTGANNLQNFPVITAISSSGGTTTITGTLNSTANTDFAIDLYNNSVADSTGFGEGATYLASQVVHTSGTGVISFTFTTSAANSNLFTLTATKKTTGDTSEFGPQGAPLVVTTTADSGVGSLRNALSAVQYLPGSTITFHIPPTDSNFKNGFWTIKPASALPALSTNGTIIDGQSQTTFGGNTNTAGPEIVLDGTNAGPDSSGLFVQASNSKILNLIIGHFAFGITIQSSSTNTASSNAVQGCYLGVGPDGLSALPNGYGLQILYGPQSNTIGGTTSTQRNVISGNTRSGILVRGLETSPSSANQIVGNYIGVSATGASEVGNGEDGVEFFDGATNNLLGGTTAPARNIISGNIGAGVAFSQTTCTDNRVIGNYIGTDSTGAHAIPNSSGVGAAAGANTVGGINNGEGNLIVFNRNYGVQVIGGSGLTVRGNSIYSNGLLGINLQGGSESFYGGVTANDALDSDSGPNNLQNYPVINSLSGAGSTTTIKGVLSSTPNRDFNIDLYRVIRPDSSNFGEGDNYLGSTTVHTAANGDGSWQFSGTFSGQYFAATATDTTTGDTSEFSSVIVSSLLTGFTPQTGKVGDKVTLTGANLTGASAVAFNGKAATFSVNSSGTSITTNVPAGATSGPISVTTPLGTVTTASDFLVTPPTNDKFVSAQLLQGNAGSVRSSNIGATVENGESEHGGPGGTSVWYKWVPGQSGRASLGISDANFDTLLAIYTGTALTNLQQLAANDNAGASTSSALSLAVVAGKTYFIAVDGSKGATGIFTLNWDLASGPPANDKFANAQIIDGEDGYLNATNLLATRETGEPQHAGNAGGASIWYAWRAPSTGSFAFDTQGSTFDTVLAVYTGTAVNSLHTVVSNDDSNGSSSRVTFNATQALTYYIAIDGFNGAQGNVTLIWSNLSPNGNPISWTGAAGDGKWGTPGNWNLNHIPGPTDIATINLAGTYTVTLNINATVAGVVLGKAGNTGNPTLSLNGGRTLTSGNNVINSNGILTLANGVLQNQNLELFGLFNWTSGTLQNGHVYIHQGATLDINSSNRKILDGTVITNTGTTKWRDKGAIYADNGAGFINQNQFNITGDSSFLWLGNGAKPNFLNDRSGVFTKSVNTSGAAATTTFRITFGNDGKTIINAGNLELNGGGVSYGAFTIASNSLIKVTQDYVFDKQTSTFTGAGFVAFVSGRTNVIVPVNTTNIQFSNGQIAGPGTLTVSNNCLWTGGVMTGSGAVTMPRGSLMQISTSTAKTITGRTLNTGGTTNWLSGKIQADSGAKITNTGTFKCATGTAFTYRQGTKLVLTNQGGAVFTGQTTIAGDVNNSGHIKPLQLNNGAPAITARDLDFNEGGGLINITGNLSQGNGSQLDVQINSTSVYGHLIVGADIALQTGCGLTVTLAGYTPQPGDSFPIMQADSITGDFTRLTLPKLTGGMSWTTSKVVKTTSTTYYLKVMGKVPSISGLVPASGPIGQVVIINGKDLTMNTAIKPTVKFGSVVVPADSVVIKSVNQLTAPVPTNAKTATVSVTSQGGTGTSAAPFTIVLPPTSLTFTPASGAIGQTLTVTGKNLTNATTPTPTVKFGTAVVPAANITVKSSSQLQILIPSTAKTGTLSVTTTGGTVTSATSFTLVGAPSITAFTLSGKVGDVVTLTGKNLTNATTAKPTVKFSGSRTPTAQIKSATATQVQVIVPAGSATGPITLTTSGGTSTTSKPFTLVTSTTSQ